MKTNYRIVSVFSSKPIYSKHSPQFGTNMLVHARHNDPGYLAQIRDSGRAYFLDFMLCPVNGAPMRARDTLLAQMLRNSPLAIPSVAKSLPQAISWSPGEFPMTEIRQRRRANPPTPRVQAPFVSTDGTATALLTKRLVGELVGVEIECYPSDVETCSGRVQDIPFSRMVCDGSLSDCGREIRMLCWQKSDGRLSSLLRLSGILESAKVNKSCGLHIHVDARHLPKISTPSQLSAIETYKRLVTLYPFLKKLVPPSRHSNRYCRFSQNATNNGTVRVKFLGERYCAINSFSLSEHGTIEWRLWPGSVNAVKIERTAILSQFWTRFASNPANKMPKTWNQFVNSMPVDLRSWVVIRAAKMAGIRFDDLSMSAADMRGVE